METSTTILLVEDNPDDEALTIRALKKNGVGNEVVVAHDGVEACEVLEKSFTARLPELMLLDLKLPRMDGLEVLAKVRADARFRVMPVVVLTSSDEDRDIVESYRLGANSYVRKPVDFDAFREAVKTLGLYWLVVNRTARFAR